MPLAVGLARKRPKRGVAGLVVCAALGLTGGPLFAGLIAVLYALVLLRITKP